MRRLERKADSWGQTIQHVLICSGVRVSWVRLKLCKPARLDTPAAFGEESMGILTWRHKLTLSILLFFGFCLFDYFYCLVSQLLFHLIFSYIRCTL